MSLSYRQVEALLTVALNRGRDPAQNRWIRDVSPDEGYVIFNEPGEGLYRVSYTITGEVAELGNPEKVEERTTYAPVKFSATLDKRTVAGNTVTWTGVIFRLGEYPDKRFSLSEKEADEAIGDFQPVDFDVEHIRSPFDGKIGRLDKVWRRGKVMYGSSTVPKAVDEILGGRPPKVSLEWDQEPKRIARIAYTLNPRITDAKLEAAAAAFSASSVVSRKEGTVKSNFLKRLFGFSDSDIADLVREAAEDDGVVADPTKSKAFTDLQSERDGLAAQVKAQTDGQIDKLAAEFADKAVTDQKVYPSERDDLMATFAQSIRDDAGGGPVTFSGDGSIVEGERAKRLRKMIDARQPHGLTKEKLSQFSAIPATGGDSPAAPVLDSRAIFAAMNGQGGK